MNVLSGKPAGWAIATTAVAALTTGLYSPAWADNIVPAVDGTGTQVIQDGRDYAITGGTTSDDAQNLFHSFQEFTLLTGESATFFAAPAVLNILGRVGGGDISLIDGLLQVSGSDANLFLINPNGILFGPNSAVNLQGSFTATTADQINFATGEWGSVGTSDYGVLVGSPESFSFTLEDPGNVVNAGRLSVESGQSVVLIGGQVLNTGTIAAPGGNIVISAVEGSSLVKIEQAGSLLNLEMEVLPAGTATSAEVFTPLSLPELLTGSAIASATRVTVNPDGTITLAGSDVAIPTETGTAIASGILTVNSSERGGNVTVLGSTVGVLSATVDASGENGGGVLRIGGDYQGQGPLPTASVTVVDGFSVLTADAIANGNGGHIILWSEETTRSYGTLSATGGNNGGDGGLVETSSRGLLETAGVPDTSAPTGAAGTWLLDPFDIEIVDGFAASDDNFPSENSFVAENGDPATIGWLDIQAALEANSMVTISTGDGGDGNGDITIVDGFDLAVTAPGSTLELLAAGDIDSPFGITNVGAPVHFRFIADADTDGSGQIRIGNPFISNGGDIVLEGADAGSALGISVDAPILSSGGNVTLRSDNADIELQSIDAGGGSVTVETALGFIRISDTPSILTLGGATIQLVHGGDGNTPFVVGDAGRNGTAGIVSNGIDELPASAYFDTISFGAIAVNTDSTGTTNEFECVSGCEEQQPPENFEHDDQIAGEETGNDPAFQDETGEGVGFQEDFKGDRPPSSNEGFDEAGPDNTDTGNGEGAGENAFQDEGGGEHFGERDNNGDGDSDRPPADERFGEDSFQDEDRGDIGDRGNDDRADNDFQDDDRGDNQFHEDEENREQRQQETDDGFREDRENEGRDQRDENRDQERQESDEENREADRFDDEDNEDNEGRRQDGRDPNTGDDFNDLTYDEWAFEDGFYADDFVSYFNLPAMPNPNVQSSQDTLRVLSRQVGTSPALVYARFVPAGSARAQLPGTKQLQNPQPTDVLQLVLVTADGQPQQIVVPDASREAVIAATRQLHREITDRTRRRLTTYLAPSQQLYDWLIRPLERVLDAEEIGHLSFIMAPGLRSLPLAALHDGEQFIIENYTVGLMPSLTLTDTRYTDLRNTPVLAMGASRFVDQPDLPAVPFELSTIVGPLRAGEQNLNEAFTPSTLISLRETSDYRILHLATHGEFRAGGPDNSYIQFWDQRLRLDQLRQLQLNDPPLELLVMSACRTALGDPSAELGFAGLAVQAGVKSAVATLWQVSDLETAGLMTEFYTQLSQRSYKAEALRQAQLAMLRGEVTVRDGTLQWSGGSLPLPEELADLRYGNTRHPYFWAAFTMVGSPW